MYKLNKVISGAQTGADQAGIETAENFGILTGGWITKSGRTREGFLLPTYIKKYGLREHSSDNYRDRTRKNVEDSDGTIIFSNWQSPGTKCTIKGCKDYKKPYTLITPGTFICPEHHLVGFILDNNIKVLNIAGHSQSLSNNMYEEVSKILVATFKSLGYEYNR